MCTEPASEFPYSFDMIQFRAVGRQKVEPNRAPMLMQPWVQESGMMPSGIVKNDNHHVSGGPVVLHMLQERLKRCGIKGVFATGHECSGTHLHCSHHPLFLTSWRML